MKKEDPIFVKHILESIGNIEDFTKNVSREQFLDSLQLQDAVIRRIEIIGEATKNISEDFQKEHHDVPWSKLAKTRDKLIHGYFQPSFYASG